MTWLPVCYISPSQLCFSSRLSLQAHTSETGNGKNFMLILYLSLFPWLPSSLKSPTKKNPVVSELIIGHQTWCPYQIMTNLQRRTDLCSFLMLMGHGFLQEKIGGGQALKLAFFPRVKGTFSKWDFITVSSECESPHLCGISSSSTNYGHLCHEEQGN